jgi:hypothetical protein
MYQRFGIFVSVTFVKFVGASLRLLQG